MSRKRSGSGWRAAALAVALFAITFNFLQPLVHAAASRDGAPSTLWSVFCNASPRETNKDVPVAAGKHECCLGLAHATAFVTPATASVLIEPATASVHPFRSIDLPIPLGIRDGPHQPRGPPSFV